MPFTASEVAQHVEGTVQGDGSVVLTGLAPADQARPGNLTFAESDDYLASALASQAAAILVDRKDVDTDKVLIRVRHPRVALAKVLSLFVPPPRFGPGMHPSAVVARSAEVDASVHVGPGCVIGEKVVIGPDTVLEGMVHLGEGCRLGRECHLHPGVSLYAGCRLGDRVRIHAGAVVGSDGFGYVFDEGRHLKIPQVGHVEVGDDVEIGANTTIDRGAMGATVIGRGSKIDNLVQIAHNVVIGDHSILVAQVGISGSTRLGNFVTLAGQVGLADHLNIGHQVTVGAKSGVMHDIPAGQTWLGIPAREATQAKRQMVAASRLTDILFRLRQMERRLATLEEAGEPPVA